MFISKKHIPRRTFLRGAGVTLALPLLEADGAGADAAPADRGDAGQAVRRHLASARRGAGLLEPDEGRPRLRLLVHHQAARAVPRSHGPHHRPRHAGSDGDRRRAGRRSRARRGAAVGRAAAAQRRQPVSRRDDRSDDRQEVRPGHDPLRRCSSASKTPATSATATGATAARTRTRSRGPRRRSRCRRR